jgi:hypothetical protein
MCLKVRGSVERLALKKSFQRGERKIMAISRVNKQGPRRDVPANQSFSTQDDMVGCIQEETEYRFLLAHSAPITVTSLADKHGFASRWQTRDTQT